MESRKNLWGELPHFEHLRTPFSILKEQASVLSEMTQGFLVGEVRREPYQQKFRLYLNIIAPALNNYRYLVATVNHPIELYPLEVENGAAQEHRWIKCETEQEFEAVLAEILSSYEIRKVISALLTDIRADVPS